MSDRPTFFRLISRASLHGNKNKKRRYLSASFLVIIVVLESRAKTKFISILPVLHFVLLPKKIYPLRTDVGQHPPPSKIETPLPACSGGSYTDRQVVQYTNQTGQRKASQFKTTGGCCPFCKDIYSLVSTLQQRRHLSASLPGVEILAHLDGRVSLPPVNLVPELPRVAKLERHVNVVDGRRV